MVHSPPGRNLPEKPGLVSGEIISEVLRILDNASAIQDIARFMRMSFPSPREVGNLRKRRDGREDQQKRSSKRRRIASKDPGNMARRAGDTVSVPPSTGVDVIIRLILRQKRSTREEARVEETCAPRCHCPRCLCHCRTCNRARAQEDAHE